MSIREIALTLSLVAGYFSFVASAYATMAVLSSCPPKDWSWYCNITHGKLLFGGGNGPEALR